MLVQIKQRRPAQLTVAAVDAPCFRLQLMTNILIGLHFPTRRRCNLRIADLPWCCGYLSSSVSYAEAPGSPLSSRDAPPRRYSSRVSARFAAPASAATDQTPAQQSHPALSQSDRLRCGTFYPVPYAFCPLRHQACFTRYRIRERYAVILSLEAQQIVITQRFQQLFMRRQRGKISGVGNGIWRKKPMRLLTPRFRSSRAKGSR